MTGVMQGFSNPSVFDPDRFSPERKEDIKYQKNFLTFGHGPHYCVGKDYAVNQIICYLANLSTRSAVLYGLVSNAPSSADCHQRIIR